MRLVILEVAGYYAAYRNQLFNAKAARFIAASLSIGLPNSGVVNWWLLTLIIAVVAHTRRRIYCC